LKRLVGGKQSTLFVRSIGDVENDGLIRMTPESQVAEVVHALGVELDVHLLLEEVPLLPLGLKLFSFS
jgi:hypothetical protein